MMCISRSVMEGSDIITPLTRVAFAYNGPRGMELLTHGIVELAKALGGSFKLVTPGPKPVREMTQLPRETQVDFDYFRYPLLSSLIKVPHLGDHIMSMLSFRNNCISSDG